MDKNIKVALDGIVQGYFEGKNLMELMQASADSITTNTLKKLFSNFKGIS